MAGLQLDIKRVEGSEYEMLIHTNIPSNITVDDIPNTQYGEFVKLFRNTQNNPTPSYAWTGYKTKYKTNILSNQLLYTSVMQSTAGQQFIHLININHG